MFKVENVIQIRKLSFFISAKYFSSINGGEVRAGCAVARLRLRSLRWAQNPILTLYIGEASSTASVLLRECLFRIWCKLNLCSNKV